MRAMKRSLIGFSFCTVILAACGGPPPAEAPPAEPVHGTTPMPEAPKAVEEPKVATPTPAPKAPEAIVRFSGVGLATPESVLYDESDDTYLVSNIDGKPTDADGNAFISKLGPDGKVITLKWIEAGKNKVTLNAPKGLAFLGDTLAVADLNNVRIFDRKTGAPKKSIPIKGATFLNDVASDGKNLFVSDSGLKLGKSGFEPTGTDAVYKIDEKGVLTTIVKNTAPVKDSKKETATPPLDLHRPNGLLATKLGVFVAPFGAAELMRINASGLIDKRYPLPKGSLDGIIAIPPNGDVYVSSWDSNSIYRADGKLLGEGQDAEFKEVITNVTSPADIGFDAKRNRLLVPLFTKDVVEVYELK